MTPEEALTITSAEVRLSKAGGAFAAKNESSVSAHDENGFYDVDLDATDTNTLGILMLSIQESPAVPYPRVYTVVPAHVYDGMVAGTDKLQVDAVEIDGSADSAERLKLGASGVAHGVTEGTPSTTVIPTGLTDTAIDHYKLRHIILTSGPLARQEQEITAYAANGDVTVAGFTSAPASGVSFIIV